MTDDNITDIEEARRRAMSKGTPESSVDYDETEADATGAVIDVDVEEPDKQRDKILACAAKVDLWHDADGVGYASVAVNDHVEHYLMRSKSFKDWLAYQYYKAHKGAPSSQAMQDALGVLHAKARFEGEEYAPAVRIGHHNGNVYVDLADDEWRAIEITPSGWRVISRPPVQFIRSRGLRPLPIPERGGSLADLEPFLNLMTEGDLKLMLGWLVMALNPQGPYPVLVVTGEQGSAKSTTVRLLRGIVDPSAAPHRAPPREERDLLVAARNSWVIAYDNISKVPPWLSDALCRIATGGGYSARQLYSDADEVIFQAMRPIILNGIPDLTERPDLADRAIILRLPFIDDSKKHDELNYWADFDAAAGRILGVLLDAACTALKRRDDVRLDRLPRMADFAIWAEAAGAAFGWRPGEFSKAYKANRDAAVGLTMAADAVAQAVVTMMKNQAEAEGTATELLAKLSGHVSEQTLKSKDWPKAPNWLSNRLRQAAPSLRAMGVEVTQYDRGSSGTRWQIRLRPQNTVICVTTVTDSGAGDANDANDAILRAQSSSDDGDADERAAIEAIDGEVDLLRDRPTFLDRTSQ